MSDNAAAVAYIIWQLALNAAKNLHVEDFRYDSDEQRIDVISEYLAFLVHLLDRLVHQRLSNEQRQEFISAAAAGVARHLQRNKEEILARGDHTGPFLRMLNRRCEEYAQCSFAVGEPGYAMLRALGSKVQEVMGADQTNKWVIDQVMEIDAPAAAGSLRRSLDNLIGPAE